MTMAGKDPQGRELQEGWAPSSPRKALTGGAGPIKAEASPMRPPPAPSDAASSAKPPSAASKAQ